jgi:hypothetical protein
MSENFKKLAQAQLGVGASTLYTVPGATQAVIKHMRVANPTGSTVSFKLWHDGTTDSFIIVPSADILAGGWAEFDGNILMETADTLSGLASIATSLTITVYGLEIA